MKWVKVVAGFSMVIFEKPSGPLSDDLLVIKEHRLPLAFLIKSVIFPISKTS